MWHQGFNRNFTKLRENILCAKKTIIPIYSAILLPELLSSAILESTPEPNQHNERCLRSACAHCPLNVSNADYILAYSPKWRKKVTLGEELLNKLVLLFSLIHAKLHTDVKNVKHYSCVSFPCSECSEEQEFVIALAHTVHAYAHIHCMYDWWILHSYATELNQYSTDLSCRMTPLTC